MTPSFTYQSSDFDLESTWWLPLEGSDAFGVHGNTSPVTCVISIPSSYPHPLGFYPPETGQRVVVSGGCLSAVGQNHFFALAGFF
ncbi:MAG: hypothetical protein V1766_06100, partial [Pseudomonadota bacterium]